MVAMAVAGALFAFNHRVLGPAGGGGEFLTLWTGSRAFLFEGTDPYGGSVPARVQQAAYGRAAVVGEEPYILDVPFHLLILFFPLALVPDAGIARAIYTVLLELALLGSIYISLRLANLRDRGLRIIYASATTVSFYSYSALSEGSPVLLLGCVYLGSLWSLTAKRYELAGALMVLSAFRWEAAAPFLVLAGLNGWKRGRGAILTGAALLGVLLFAISVFLYPGWLIPLWRAVTNNLRYEYGFSTGAMVAQLAPNSAAVIRWVVAIALLLLIGREVMLAREEAGRPLYWSAFIVLTATPLLGQRSEIENLVPLMFAWPFLLGAAHGRWGRVGGILASLLMLLAFLAPWWLSREGRAGGALSPMQQVFLLLPIATLLALYWMRWSALHAPRTWIERFAEH